MVFIKKTPTYCHILKLYVQFLQPKVRTALGMVALRWSGNKETFSQSSLLSRKRPWEWLAAKEFSRDWREISLGKNV